MRGEVRSEPTPTRARTWLRRTIALVALVGSLVWIYGAIPVQLRFGPMREQIPALRQRLKAALRVTPGQYVFTGDRSHDRMLHRYCMVVFGVDEAGATSRLYESYPGCRPPAVRWRASGLEVALSRIISDRLSLTLGTTRGAKRRAKMIRRFAKHRRAARVADFFCDTHGEALAEVVLAARTVSIEYATPKTQVHRDVFHRYSCRAERSAPIAGLRLIEGDGALSLAGVGGAR